VSAGESARGGAVTAVPAPLSGVVVLDLSHFLAGPYAGLALADLGADVIKVEDPGRPDEARSIGPCFSTGQSDYFGSLNWGKRSLAVRLSDPAGRDAFLQVVRHADVVIDNYKPGVMDKLGLSPAALHNANERVVTCTLSGFGATGPLARRPGYDYTIQALAGVMSLTGDPDRPPGKAGISYVDHCGGLVAALGVAAALVQRSVTGAGRHLDLSLFDAQVSMMTYLASWQLNAGYETGRRADGAHPSIVPAQTFPTADGHMSVFVGNDPMFRRLAEALGDPYLADERFAANAGRHAARDELIAHLQALFTTRTTEDWVTLLAGRDVACAAVNSVAGALAEPQVQARGLIAETGPSGPAYRHVRGPVPLDDGRAAMAAPLLGEHSSEVLGAAGMPAEQIRDLIDRGVVVEARGHPRVNSSRK
jgi:crotonobetainyl-CoA:carnitine CoA-transferase CaiB-like acyl-CoA transferase